MSKHTPEPWKVFVKGRTLEVQDGAGLPIAAWPGFDDSRRPIAEHRANVLRIVACVNACEGIDPGAVKELLEAAKAFLAPNHSPETWEIAHQGLVAAIAKAKK